MEPITISVPAARGSAAATLKGQVFAPEGTPKAATVIHCATGVPAGYYRYIAEWMAQEHGRLVLTYDYRAMGASATGPARQTEASMIDWGLHDQNAALNALAERADGAPLEVIGHSLGGLMTFFHDRAAEVTRLNAVCAGPAYIWHHPRAQQLLALGLWYGPGAASVAAMGYLPGKYFGLGEDIPAGAYYDWRRWCTSPGFHERDWGGRLPEPDLGVLTGTVRLVAIEDDWISPPKVIDAAQSWYPAAEVTRETLRPADFGHEKIGHIDAFRRRYANLWPALTGLS